MLHTTVNDAPLHTADGKYIYIDYDADAYSYIQAVENAGCPLTSAKKANINWTFKAIKAEPGLWDSLPNLYLLEGGTATCAAINAIDTTATRIVWNNVTDGEFDTDGWQNDGNGWGNTGFNPSTALNSATSSHQMFYCLTTAIPAAVYYDMGIRLGTNPQWLIRTRSNTATSLATSYSNVAGYYFSAVSITTVAGMYINNRESATAYQYVYNGAVLGSLGNYNAAYPPPNAEMFIGARNQDGSASSITNRKYACFSIGYGLSESQRTAFSKIIMRYVQNK